MMNLEFVGIPDGLLSILSAAAIFTTSFATVAGLLGRWRWQFDLFSHFRVQYLILLVFFTGVSLFFDNVAVSLLGMGFIIFNLSSILPFYTSQHQTDLNQKTTRILLSNVLKPNNEYDKLCKVIQETKPDIIFLLEISEIWLRELAPVLERYPYRHAVLRSDNYGLAIYSQFSFNDIQTVYFSDAQVPSLVIGLEINNRPLKIIGTHPPPPKSETESIFRNQQMKNIAAYITQRDEICMLLGDLNSSSWSPHFQELMKLSRLHDSRKGFGIQPTWPSDKPLFMVPIDHVLVSKGIRIHKRFIGPDIGSDHRPVIVDFSLENYDGMPASAG